MIATRTAAARRGIRGGRGVRAFALSAALGLPLFAAGLLAGPSATVHAAAGWTSNGATILDPSGHSFSITGINWYGFETTSFVAHGLYAQDYTTIVDEIRQDGYSTIRIPFSSQMWEQDPIVKQSRISACPNCRGRHARDILAMIINRAGADGLHVILDNHRSEAGNSAEADGLWYATSGGTTYTESSWIHDWTSVEDWISGVAQTQGATDTVAVSPTAADGFPTVLGFDLRNEPHTPSHTAYLQGATWGTGDGVDPTTSPNPNPFTPACVATSSCHDWRLAAERAADTVLGRAVQQGRAQPLIFVEGVSQYPLPGASAASGPYDYYWWGGELEGVNGNTGNPGAPVVLNAGGNASGLGPAVAGQLVYSAHDYGPTEYAASWFNSSTCYRSGCSSSSLADLWNAHWAYIDAGGVSPVTAGGGSYPWGTTGATAYASAPVWIGEFGTGNSSSDLASTGAGSQGQWFTDLVDFMRNSDAPTATTDPGLAHPVVTLNWTYWALNTEDTYALLGANYLGVASSTKEYSYLCAIQQGPLRVASGGGSGQCNGSLLPAPS
jgi:endoglucanase